MIFKCYQVRSGLVPGRATVRHHHQVQEAGAGGQEEAEAPQEGEAGLDDEGEGCDEER